MMTKRRMTTRITKREKLERTKKSYTINSILLLLLREEGQLLYYCTVL
jgi:hypothetical protein